MIQAIEFETVVIWQKALSVLTSLHTRAHARANGHAHARANGHAHPHAHAHHWVLPLVCVSMLHQSSYSCSTGSKVTPENRVDVGTVAGSDEETGVFGPEAGLALRLRMLGFTCASVDVRKDA